MVFRDKNDSKKSQKAYFPPLNPTYPIWCLNIARKRLQSLSMVKCDENYSICRLNSFRVYGGLQGPNMIRNDLKISNFAHKSLKANLVHSCFTETSQMAIVYKNHRNRYVSMCLELLRGFNLSSCKNWLSYTPGRNETFLSIAVDRKCSKPCTVRITLHAIQ